MNQPRSRQPAVFLNHGAGPCFWMDWPAPLGPGAFDRLDGYLQGLIARLPARPTAALVVSAHWEAERPTVGTAAAPPMLFDYYGFPEATYRLRFPASGSPELGRRVRDLLAAAGIDTDEDAERGFDHGVFVPFLRITPNADLPVVALSLCRDLDPARHLAIGAALAPLRDEGVLIVGSGQSYHNLARFTDGDGATAEAFDSWLNEAATASDPQVRNRKLATWTAAPAARAAHPREEHLLPLMVVAGAAGADPGRRAYDDRIGGKRFSGYEFAGCEFG